MYEIHGVRFVTRTEASAMLGSDVTAAVISEWVRRGILVPVCKLAGKNIFRWDDVVTVEHRTRTSGKGRARGLGKIPLTIEGNEDTMSKIAEQYLAARSQGRRFAPPMQPLDKMVVYYLRFDRRVKIGYSSNIVSRLQVVPHDEVLALEPGGRDLERQRHDQFARDRVNREWFKFSPAIRAHAQQLVEQHGTPAQLIRGSYPVPPSHRKYRGNMV